MLLLELYVVSSLNGGGAGFLPNLQNMHGWNVLRRSTQIEAVMRVLEIAWLSFLLPTTSPRNVLRLPRIVSLYA